MKRKGATIFELMFVVIFLGVIIGNIIGIYKFATCDFEAPYKAEIIYGIGIPTGLNAILGWIDFGK